MTDDSRAPLEGSREGDSPQPDPAPRQQEEEAGGAKAESAGGGEGFEGFAPPDAHDDRLLIPPPVRGQAAPPPGPWSASVPGMGEQGARPGFAPPSQPPSQPYGWPADRPQPYSGGPGLGEPSGPGFGGPGGPGRPGVPGGFGSPGGPGVPLPGPAGGFGGPTGPTVPIGAGPNWAPVPPSPTRPRRTPGLGVLVVLGIVIALVAGALGAGIMAATTNDAAGDNVDLDGGNGSTTTGGGTANRAPDSVAGTAKRVLPSVVMIRIESGTGDSGAGTGFITRGGYIITNNHVVAAADGGNMEVVFSDQKTASAKIVGTDPSSDVAVIKPDTTNNLPALELGNSDDIAVGDPVIAIGSPLGLSGTVTTGIVSALNRPVSTQGDGGGDAAILNAVQTDAAINPGNSGGPLVDARGRVIGINTAIATVGGQGFGGDQGGNIGVGFAIPINQGKRVAEQLINNGGKATHAIIGATMDLRYQGDGVRIATEAQGGQAPLISGGPAERAGLRPGDVITNFDGKPVTRPEELIALIRSRAPGDKVKLTYNRGGRPTTVELTLAESN